MKRDHIERVKFDEIPHLRPNTTVPNIANTTINTIKTHSNTPSNSLSSIISPNRYKSEIRISKFETKP